MADNDSVGDGLGCLGICLIAVALIVATAWVEISKQQHKTRQLEIEKGLRVPETDPPKLPAAPEARR